MLSESEGWKDDGVVPFSALSVEQGRKGDFFLAAGFR